MCPRETLNGSDSVNGCGETVDFVKMANLLDIELTPADIPGAELLEPLEKYTVPALKWWMTCRGNAVPSSIKIAALISQ